MSIFIICWIDLFMIKGVLDSVGGSDQVG